jgi:uncharacterized protein (UPF0261 family)
VIDGGILGEPLFQPDITREQVAEAAGKSLKELLVLGEAAKPIEVMAKGCSEIAEGLYAEGKLDGIIAIGGILGTTLGIAAMKRLPLWLPKLMVSAIGLSPFSPVLDPELSVKDVTVMPTVADLWGVDNITKTILQNAAGAIAGMVETHEKTGPSQRPLIDIITFGTVVCKQALWAKPLLEQRGYDVIVFEATENASEELVDQGLMRGTLDFVAGYLFTNEFCGGAPRPWPMRFEARIRRGIPQVFSPGLAEAITWSEAFGPLPQRFENRKIYPHGAMAICIKASEEEMAASGVRMAQKLNEMTGPTAMLIPIRGFSEWDKQGHMWYDPEGRKAFIEGLKKHIGPKVKVVELDMHINDREFAEQAVTIFDEMMRGQFSS